MSEKKESVICCMASCLNVLNNAELVIDRLIEQNHPALEYYPIELKGDVIRAKKKIHKFLKIMGVKIEDLESYSSGNDNN